jgi:hypothetical protein
MSKVSVCIKFFVRVKCIAQKLSKHVWVFSNLISQDYKNTSSYDLSTVFVDIFIKRFVVVKPCETVGKGERF